MTAETGTLAPGEESILALVVGMFALEQVEAHTPVGEIDMSVLEVQEASRPVLDFAEASTPVL